jgi:hypothetical protein
MWRGEGLKLNTDSLRSGPAYNGSLNEDRRLVIGDIEQEIYLHARKGSKRTFEPTAFDREIQRLVNLMEPALVDQGAGESYLESRILSHHHIPWLFSAALPLDGCMDSR